MMIIVIGSILSFAGIGILVSIFFSSKWKMSKKDKKYLRKKIGRDRVDLTRGDFSVLVLPLLGVIVTGYDCFLANDWTLLFILTPIFSLYSIGLMLFLKNIKPFWFMQFYDFEEDY